MVRYGRIQIKLELFLLFLRVSVYVCFRVPFSCVCVCAFSALFPTVSWKKMYICIVKKQNEKPKPCPSVRLKKKSDHSLRSQTPDFSPSRIFVLVVVLSNLPLSITRKDSGLFLSFQLSVLPYLHAPRHRVANRPRRIWFLLSVNFSSLPRANIFLPFEALLSSPISRARFPNDGGGRTSFLLSLSPPLCVPQQFFNFWCPEASHTWPELRARFHVLHDVPNSIVRHQEFVLLCESKHTDDSANRFDSVPFLACRSFFLFSLPAFRPLLS